MARNGRGTIQTTRLVHDLYERLATRGFQAENRQHFDALCATAMRRLLIDLARQRSAAKRGDGRAPVICAMAMSEGPTQRYRSVLHMRGDPERLLTYQPVQARPAESLYRARRFLQRHRAGATVAAVLSVAMLLTAGLPLRQHQTLELEANYQNTLSTLMNTALKDSSSTPAQQLDVAIAQLLQSPANSPRVQARMLNILAAVFLVDRGLASPGYSPRMAAKAHQRLSAQEHLHTVYRLAYRANFAGARKKPSRYSTV